MNETIFYFFSFEQLLSLSGSVSIFLPHKSLRGEGFSESLVESSPPDSSLVELV